MKKLVFLAIAAAVVTGITFTSCNSGKSVNLKTDKDSVSYIIGSFWGAGQKSQLKSAPGGGLNLDVFIESYLKAFGEDTLISVLGMDTQTAQNFMNNYFQNVQVREAAEAKSASDNFLIENGAKSGVITTESGLQYKVITEGTGPKPKLENTVKVHYHGTKLNGEVFESSVDRGEPQEMLVGGVIEGLKEALQLMPVGSKYKIWIPVDLAYGGNPNHPLQKDLLVFEVEILEIVK